MISITGQRFNIKYSIFSSIRLKLNINKNKPIIIIKTPIKNRAILNVECILYVKYFSCNLSIDLLNK